MIARLTGTVSKETIQEITEALVDQLRQIPEERRQQPKPNVAVPAIEAMAYSWDEQQLRGMYLNLIRRAADSESADAVHPSFVDAIRQLGPEEAVILDEVLRHRALWPAARIMLRDPETKRLRVTCPVTLPLIVRPQAVPRVLPHLPSWVENWSRLGFVRVDFGAQPVATNGSSIDPFFWVRARPEWFEAQRLASEAVEVSERFGWVPDFRKGTLDVTALGADFLRIVG